ncbi:MAG: hypothetical protein ABSG25_12005 [Bryobacteraceae bacterium]
MISVKARVRIVWIFITNGVMLYEKILPLIPHGASLNRLDMWFFEGVLSSLVLVCGLAAEVRQSRWAKYLNVGFYLYSGLWGVFGVIAASYGWFGYTNESWIYFFLVGLPSLLVAVINYFLYR